MIPFDYSQPNRTERKKQKLKIMQIIAKEYILVLNVPSSAQIYIRGGTAMSFLKQFASRSLMKRTPKTFIRKGSSGHGHDDHHHVEGYEPGGYLFGIPVCSIH